MLEIKAQKRTMAFSFGAAEKADSLLQLTFFPNELFAVFSRRFGSILTGKRFSDHQHERGAILNITCSERRVVLRMTLR